MHKSNAQAEIEALNSAEENRDKLKEAIGILEKSIITKAQNLREKRKTLESSLKSDREREERLELLNYAVDEITKANIQTGEIRELENEMQKLSDFEKLISFINTASDCFVDNEKSVLNLTRRAKNALENASTVDSSLGEINRRFDNLYYEAEDIAQEFRSYKDRLAFDPQRLEEVNERLSLLYN